MRFDGAVYEARAVEVAPSAGQGLGTGVVPGCDDTVFVRGRDAPPEVEALGEIRQLEDLVQQGECDTEARARAVRKLALLRTRIENRYYVKAVAKLSR